MSDRQNSCQRLIRPISVRYVFREGATGAINIPAQQSRDLRAVCASLPHSVAGRSAEAFDCELQALTD